MLLKHRIIKGDTVIITKGVDRGTIGKILFVKKISKNIKVVVENCSTVTKHIGRSREKQGSVIQKNKLIDISNVSYYDKEKNQMSKVGYKFVDGKKKRFCKLSDKIIE